VVLEKMDRTTSNPRQVDISLSRGVEITWEDGHASRYELKYLRERCPCATCRAEPQAHPEPPNPLQMYKPAPKLTNAETVGRYAIRLFWADGHSSGLYSFDYLRESCPCSECRKTVASDK
jgi:DUF971 family protein